LLSKRGKETAKDELYWISKNYIVYSNFMLFIQTLAISFIYIAHYVKPAAHDARFPAGLLAF